MKLSAERLTVEGAADIVSDEFYRRGWTDGLPIIPPTPQRVERMLESWRCGPAQTIGLLPPAFAPATLEKVAINAVMAGCLPVHLPAIVSALDAMLDPAFNLNGIQCTTSATAPLVVFNGPIRREAEINCGANALGPGSRSNAVIGRALRLILLTIGGATPGEVDKASLGQPGKYCFCCGENEEQSPWPPFHVDRGWAADDSAVTVIGATGSIEVRDSFSQSGEGILKTMAHSITSAGFVAANHAGGGGQAVILFTPEHARAIHAAGFSKSDARSWLWREATMSLEDFPPETAEVIAAWQRTTGITADGTVRVTRRPEDILMFVVGGDGTKSAFIPTWGGITCAVTRPVRDAAASSL